MSFKMSAKEEECDLILYFDSSEDEENKECSYHDSSEEKDMTNYMTKRSDKFPESQFTQMTFFPNTFSRTNT